MRAQDDFDYASPYLVFPNSENFKRRQILRALSDYAGRCRVTPSDVAQHYGMPGLDRYLDKLIDAVDAVAERV